MCPLQNSSVSFFDSHHGITEGMVKVERFLVPLGRSQGRLRAGECELPEEKQQRWQEFSGFWFIPALWQQLFRQHFNLTSLGEAWLSAGERHLLRLHKAPFFSCSVPSVPVERGSFSLHSEWWAVVLSIFCWVSHKHRLSIWCRGTILCASILHHVIFLSDLSLAKNEVEKHLQVAHFFRVEAKWSKFLTRWVYDP